MKTYDVIVIGTGTAGQTAAFGLCDSDLTVAVIEQSGEPGGTCALHGCQPKKYFYEAAEAVARCSHLKGRGITKAPRASWQDVLIAKNKFTKDIPETTADKLKNSGIDYYGGKARFTGPSTLMAGEEEIRGRFIVIATGAEPVQLPVKGAQQMITSNDFLALQDLPRRIAFVGGGFISFEFAHFAARLGSRPGDIHILEAQKQVLNPFDSGMVKQLVAASKAEGIVIHTEAETREVEKKADGFRVSLESGENFEVDLVVNAAGRQPSIKHMNLEAGNIEYSKAGITVDNGMKTSSPGVFAVGDCTDSVKLARVADMEAKTAVDAILNQVNGSKFSPMDYRVVPAVLFTYPQLGMVGKTEDDLKQEQTPYRKSADTELNWPTYRRIGLRHGAYTILVGEDDRILGAHFLCDSTTGLVNTFAQAMRAGATVRDIYENHILAPYPSRESDILYMLSSLMK
jgi:glutathione reductase (NADPH)